MTTTQPFRSEVTRAAGNLLSVYLDVDQSKAINLNKGYERALAAKLKAASGPSFVTDDDPEERSSYEFCQRFNGPARSSRKDAGTIFATGAPPIFLAR
jgi:hypothetical protein